MKKALFDLGQEERNRILEMHQTATKKQYLMEDTKTGDELLLLEIISLIERITDRTDFDLSSLEDKDREMYKKLGDIEGIITTTLLPKYGLYDINSSEWKTFINKLSNPSVNFSSLQKIGEFIGEVRSVIEEQFPSIELEVLKEIINQFNESLNN
jgi:hypothetical protein